MKLTGLGALSYALISVYLWPLGVAATIINRTIDDQFGDLLTGRRPTYFPPENVWNNQLTCDPNCAIRPNDTYAYDGTYTVATYRPTTGLVPVGISMQFNGTAIYVFFILANNQTEGIINLTTANFTIDDNAPVLFTHIPSRSTNTLQYRALVFAQTNLSNALHTLNITIMGSVSVYVNFDYAIYTYDDIASATSLSTSQGSSTSYAVPLSTAATRAKTSAGAIVGGIAGGIVILVFVMFLLFCWHRRGGYGAVQRFRRGGEQIRVSREQQRLGSSDDLPPAYTDTETGTREVSS